MIVDDHELLGELLVFCLDRAGLDRVVVVDPASLTRDRVMTVAEGFRPDVVLLDLFLGEAGLGTTMIAPLVALGARVLVVSASEDRTLLAECLEAGASGLFSKARPFDELVEMIIDAAEGRTVLKPTVREELLAELRHSRRASERALEPFGRLTAREVEVLAALMNGRLADEIATTDGVSIGTIRAQIRSILQKLGVNSQLAVVALARRAGWGSSTDPNTGGRNDR